MIMIFSGCSSPSFGSVYVRSCVFFNDITGEYLVNPVKLRAVRYLSRRVLALNEVKAVPVLTLAEAGRSLAGDIPPVKR
jgi:hypothetical protein